VDVDGVLGGPHRTADLEVEGLVACGQHDAATAAKWGLYPYGGRVQLSGAGGREVSSLEVLRTRAGGHDGGARDAGLLEEQLLVQFDDDQVAGHAVGVEHEVIGL